MEVQGTNRQNAIQLVGWKMACMCLMDIFEVNLPAVCLETKTVGWIMAILMRRERERERALLCYYTLINNALIDRMERVDDMAMIAKPYTAI